MINLYNKDIQLYPSRFCYSTSKHSVAGEFFGGLIDMIWIIAGPFRIILVLATCARMPNFFCWAGSSPKSQETWEIRKRKHGNLKWRCASVTGCIHEIILFECRNISYYYLTVIRNMRKQIYWCLCISYHKSEYQCFPRVKRLIQTSKLLFQRGRNSFLMPKWPFHCSTDRSPQAFVFRRFMVHGHCSLANNFSFHLGKVYNFPSKVLTRTHPSSLILGGTAWVLRLQLAFGGGFVAYRLQPTFIFYYQGLNSISTMYFFPINPFVGVAYWFNVPLEVMANIARESSHFLLLTSSYRVWEKS